MDSNPRTIGQDRTRTRPDEKLAVTALVAIETWEIPFVSKEEKAEKVGLDEEVPTVERGH